MDEQGMAGAEEDAREMVAADPSDEPHPYAGWKIRGLLAVIDRERARVAELEMENRQQAQIMREQGAELRDAEEEAYQAWCASQDGP